jgi:hypothetical protein
MVDMALSLDRRGHTGKITAVSPRGLLCSVHRPVDCQSRQRFLRHPRGGECVPHLASDAFSGASDAFSRASDRRLTHIRS